MSREKTHYTPNPRFTERFPSISGNQVNGLGETVPRPASPFFWHKTHLHAFGADWFCGRCQVCTNACPPDAIFSAKQMVRGVRKWYVDFDKCIPYFGDTLACGICIARCPWSTPERAPRLAERFAKRVNR